MECGVLMGIEEFSFDGIVLRNLYNNNIKI